MTSSQVVKLPRGGGQGMILRRSDFFPVQPAGKLIRFIQYQFNHWYGCILPVIHLQQITVALVVEHHWLAGGNIPGAEDTITFQGICFHCR